MERATIIRHYFDQGLLYKEMLEPSSLKLYSLYCLKKLRHGSPAAYNSAHPVMRVHAVILSHLATALNV